MQGREGFLRRLEDGLTRMSGWMTARRRGGEHGAPVPADTRLEAIRRDVARLRRAAVRIEQDDVARIRRSLDDMTGDYEVPSPYVALSHGEREALRRHLRTTARLLRDRSDLDDPNWEPANEEYDRSWADLERAFEAAGEPASP
ncbi:hypothetical protein [Anaeromyxobacter oryzisoli]|uniref:hypothetical protein n=1 Tax=Anaeromyxobacter oryzisoli TaxID=2925408 RepID=UPI001F5610D1|nr:hypothetical protein [Anaeromyxobacter sp. SG63]